MLLQMVAGQPRLHNLLHLHLPTCAATLNRPCPNCNERPINLESKVSTLYALHAVNTEQL